VLAKKKGFLFTIFHHQSECFASLFANLLRIPPFAWEQKWAGALAPTAILLDLGRLYIFSRARHIRPGKKSDSNEVFH